MPRRQPQTYQEWREYYSKHKGVTRKQRKATQPSGGEGRLASATVMTAAGAVGWILSDLLAHKE